MIPTKNYPQVEKALLSAEQITQQYLPMTEKEQSEAVVHHVHNHYHLGYGYSPCDSSFASWVNSGFRMMGALSTVATFAMTYFVGKNVMDCMHIQESLKTLDAQRHRIPLEPSQESSALFSSLSNMFAKERNFLNYIDAQAKQALALKTILLSSSALTMIGSVIHSIALLQIGLVGVTISAGVLLYRYNYGSENVLTAQYAQELQNAVAQARQHFPSK